VGLFGVAAAVAGLGPALVGSSVRTSLGATQAAVAGTSRVVRGAVELAVGVPVAVARSATAVVGGEPTRRVWSQGGRAQIEVWGLDGATHQSVVAGVQGALTALDGVSWARVDGVTRRVVVRCAAEQLGLPDLVGVVAAAERAAGVTAPGYGPEQPSFPGDAQPVTMQVWALAADVVGLSAAVAGWATRLPALPGSATAAVVLVDNQPRLRRVLETRIGSGATDLAVAVSNAAVQGLTQGTASLVVDTAQRAQALLAARARRDTFTAREGELCAVDRPVRSGGWHGAARPVPLPPGPIERYADRTAAGSLIAAGSLFAATGSVDLAGRVLLVGAPKAARAAREAFADTLGFGLARRGVLVLDPAALRRLDRVDTVVVDTRILHGTRPVVLSATARAGHWSTGHVWSAAQRLLQGGPDLPLPPPRGRHRHRLTLRKPTQGPAGLSLRVLVEDGTPVGDVVVGTELDPYADAVLTAAQSAGVRLVLTHDPGAPELAGRADEVLAGPSSMAGQIHRLQTDGQVVAVLAAEEAALAVADVGIGVIPPAGRVPWAADILCGPGLLEVPRLLAAVPAARTVSARGVTSAMAATFLGGSPPALCCRSPPPPVSRCSPAPWWPTRSTGRPHSRDDFRKRGAIA